MTYSKPTENVDEKSPVLAVMRELGVVEKVSGNGRAIIYAIDADKAKEWSDTFAQIAAAATAAHDAEKTRIFNLRKAQK